MNLGNICNGIQVAGYNLDIYGSFWSDYTAEIWMRRYPLGEGVPTWTHMLSPRGTF